MAIPIERALEVARQLDPGAFRSDQLRSLYRYAQLAGEHPTIVEIGVYHGCSTIAMACALYGSTGRLVGIDPIFRTGTFECSDAHQGRLSYTTDVDRLRRTLRSLSLEKQVILVPQTSEETFKQWDGCEIDLLVVDGEHTAEGVRRDCEWLRYVRVGGYAAFDDWFDIIKQTVERSLLSYGSWRLLHESIHPMKGDWAVTLCQRQT